MNKTKILNIIRNVALGIVAIEFIILIHTTTNKISELKNKTNDLEKQIIELKRGN